ncbi:IS21 family transposase [Halioxenophilus aromaticivorans]|uniref:IS21 family transposase n=2 Tax=Halioxenophilus aromaticivorans TaxID=1306992 RepID=UPI0036F36A1D
MPGQHITQRQEELYMQHRQQGMNQEAAAAKAGISVRSGRRIENASTTPRPKHDRNWRTREDPLEAVWETELVPLLRAEPDLTGTTLLEYLEEHYPTHYDQRILRTLQRRVKQWKALHGPDKPVIFRQQAEPGRQGFSDFTHPDSAITIAGEPFKHLLYQFRLAFSGWRSVTIVQGGESYAALSTGLQRALQQAGGSPIEHRTDSLSAARNNRQNLWTDAYADLCSHYNMTPTRNNLGESHENGIVECANGSLKRRLSQQLKLRGSHDFDSIESYQHFTDQVVERLNRRSHSRFQKEKQALQGLPEQQAANYQTLNLKVTRSSTIEVRRVVYSVPSRLIGERVQVRLYHDKLMIYVGQQVALTLARIYPANGHTRAKSIDYKHLIHALAAKPQAFRYSQLRDELLPDDNYRQLWQYADKALESRQACKWIVTVLRLAYEYDAEKQLGEELLVEVKSGKFASIKTIQDRFFQPSQSVPELQGRQHDLQSYDALLSSLKTQKSWTQEAPF